MNVGLTALEQLATKANLWLDCAKAAEDRAHDLRIWAGSILADAKDRVRAGEPGHTNWARWIRENIKHSSREANRCIAIANRAMTMANCVAIARSSVAIDTVKRDIQLLSATDRAALTKWLMPDNKVQQERYGNVPESLGARLTRILYQLTEEINSKASKHEQYIYNELSLLARSQISDYHHNRVISLQFAIGELVSDLTAKSLSQPTFSEANESYQNGLRELKAIVTELSVLTIDREAA